MQFRFYDRKGHKERSGGRGHCPNRYVGFPSKHLIYPFLTASCFGVVQVARKLGLSHAGPVFDAALNMTAAMIAATAFVLVTGNRRALVCDRLRENQ
jgi:hypothetical protein